MLKLFWSGSRIKTPVLLFGVILWFMIGFPKSTSAQSKTNLEIFYTLIDSAFIQLTGSVKSGGRMGMNGSSSIINPFCLMVNNSGSFALFNNHIYSLGEKYGIQLCELGNNNDSILANNKQIISFTIRNIETKYPEMFRSGFLGTHLLEREIKLSGDYIITGNSVQKFNVIYEDTIRVDEVKQVENDSYSFTKGELPIEPFFSGLLEPAAAISVSATAIILFFLIRSK